MRKYIILDIPINDIKKVMIVEVEDEVNMFLYNTSDDVPSIEDYSFETLQEAEDFFNKEFSKGKDSNTSWIYVPNPTKDCQEDIITPVRIKDINTGNPQWGSYEGFVNGKWIEIKF